MIRDPFAQVKDLREVPLVFFFLIFITGLITQIIFITGFITKKVGKSRKKQEFGGKGRKSRTKVEKVGKSRKCRNA